MAASAGAVSSVSRPASLLTERADHGREGRHRVLQGFEGVAAEDVRFDVGPGEVLADGGVVGYGVYRFGEHRAHGWSNDLWTAARAAVVIRRKFGVSYHVEHVRHILKDRLGWSSPVPQDRPGHG